MKPIEIYKFEHLNRPILATSYDVAIPYNGDTYPPHSIKRSEIEDTQDSGRRSITIDISLNSELVSIFRTTSPVESVKIKIVRINQVSTTVQNAFVLFSGTVEMPVWGSNSVKLTCKPSMSKAKVQGLRCKYSSLCNHSQFDSHCGLNFNSYSIELNVTAVNGSGYEIEVDLDGYSESLSGSTIKSSTGWGTVSSQNGPTLSLFRPVPGLVVGDKLKVAKSCGQDWQVCRDTFNNLKNCLAFVDIPRKNPYTGDGLKGDV